MTLIKTYDPDGYMVAVNGYLSTSVQTLEEIVDAVNDGGSSSGFDAMVYSVTDYGATGDGTTDDTAAIQACIDAAMAVTDASGCPTVWFPRPAVAYLISESEDGAWCLNIDGSSYPGNNAGHVKLAGDMAKIRFPSTSVPAFYVLDTNDFSATGLYLIGDTDTSFTTNNQYGFRFVTNCIDVTVTRCTFSSCSPIIFGTDGDQSGRCTVTNCRFFDCTNALNVPFYSTISGCYFINQEWLLTRSHAIYIFGPAYGCQITGCVFKYIDKEAIQIRASDARYNLKRGWTITGNYFEYCSWGVWIGSDSTCEVGNATVSSNTFRNCGCAIAANGLRDGVIADNSAEWTWDAGFDSEASLNSAIYVSSGGAGHPSIPNSVRVNANKLIIRHPFFGKLRINTLPVAGETVTVGTPVNNGRTYTWTNSGSPSLDQVTIGANIRACVENLGTAIRGENVNGSPMNRVLRDEQDVFWSPFNYDSDVNLLVIASRNTFALSTTASGTTVTAVVDNRLPGIPIQVIECMYPSVSNNTIQDFSGGLQVVRCVSPTIQANTLTGCSISGSGNAFPVYRDNRFVWSPSREVEGPRPYRWLFCGYDGFPVLDNNGLVTGQETQCIQMSGKVGVTPVGDGKARTCLYYGTEGGTTGFPETLPFAWQDGDNIYLDDGATETFQANFKRVSPNAGASPPEFNTADGLIALINAGTEYTAAYVPFVDIAGGTTDPKVMIEIKKVLAGTDGNAHRLYFTRSATPNQFSYRTIGQMLRYNPTTGGSGQEDFARFLGGAATAVATPVFSPIASSVGGARVQGVDLTSHTLAPVVFAADVLEGVGFTVTHTVAAGTEAFFYDVVTP